MVAAGCDRAIAPAPLLLQRLFILKPVTCLLYTESPDDKEARGAMFLDGNSRIEHDRAHATAAASAGPPA
jgi:hypothetical protein